MELKFRIINDLDTVSSVLIVPLWNWNRDGTGLYLFGNFSFNRTFMELKYTYTFKDLAITYRFNRTFMELKFCNSKSFNISINEF